MGNFTILPPNDIAKLFLLPSSTNQHPHQQYLMVPQEIRMPVLELRQGQPELGKMPIAGLRMFAHRSVHDILAMNSFVANSTQTGSPQLLHQNENI